MQFTPKTEEELEQEGLLEEGRYPFTIKKADEKTSKKNQPYFNVKLFVHAPDERDWHIYDNPSPAFMAHKLRHLCYGTGLEAKYEAGTLTCDDLIERQGYVEIGIQKAKGAFPAKNVVIDYVVESEAAPAKPVPAKGASTEAPPPEDDDVPF